MPVPQLLYSCESGSPNIIYSLGYILDNFTLGLFLAMYIILLTETSFPWKIENTLIS